MRRHHNIASIICDVQLLHKIEWLGMFYNW